MIRDLIFSLRELRKHPGLAVTAILSLTLGIGATTAVFSVIYALLVNPYPYVGADRMVYLNLLNERGDNRGVGVTGAQYKALRQGSALKAWRRAGGRGISPLRMRICLRMSPRFSFRATPALISVCRRCWGVR